jgi:TonB family protein
MFEATLHAADPDHQRLQRLTLAAAIALASTATAIASVWTLERLHIDRIGGPSQKFEITHLSLLPPPKPVDPPPPPKFVEPDSSVASTSTSTVKPTVSKLVEDSASDAGVQATKPSVGVHNRGVPDFGGGASCPGGLCLGTNSGGGNTPCVGPQCGTSSSHSKTTVDSAPAEVEFSALRCLACADPDRAALRKTNAGMQRRNGKVVARFCVDHNGRVEARSIQISRSHGDAAVDRITTAALQGWRFSPMKIGNAPRRACSSATFNIRFD